MSFTSTVTTTEVESGNHPLTSSSDHVHPDDTIVPPPPAATGSSLTTHRVPYTAAVDDMTVRDTDNKSDIEDGVYTLRDPLLLHSMKQSDDALASMATSSRHSKKLRNFYRSQNEHIDFLLSPLNPIDEDAEKNLLKLKIAVYGSTAANVLLFVLQLVAAISSGSLSLFATMADAFMDLLSGITLMVANRASRKKNWDKYPAGKKKMETAGIIVFSCLMATVSIQLIIESVRTLAAGEHSTDLSPMSISFVAVALGLKFVLFLYCTALRRYQSAKIFAQDHRNDLIVNGLGLTTALLGSHFASWLDPVGAILVACIIFGSWGSTAWEHIQLIVGKSADVTFLQRITYIAMTHDPRVLQVDTCRAYHSGENLYVEVDLVLPPDMMLRESHDILESLQIKLESIPEVERAFVHGDYETSHKPEHRKDL
ncbi:hypothetical protein BZG36_01295 [Bifiguratus adelaidae]|uniref:Uncharacterized protein n=1 Tax=Bifiguratus adelaidae TaxID=1938954 RepID=A0A261Y590_9FUNG|nr:hypothetical protein BZG36_01295 [Bifiguratus adelaidae]